MTLHERLQDVFQSVFNNGELELTDETTAAQVAGWDSVAHVNLMFGIEQTFDIQFAGNELAEFKNIGELKAYLRDRGCV